MLSKKNNYLFKTIMKLILFCVVGIYSAPAWTETDQVETVPADSAQVVPEQENDEQEIIEQDQELLAETEALIEDLKAKSKDAREKFAIVKKATGEKRSLAGTQVLDIEKEIRKSLDTLIENIKTLESQDVDTSNHLKAAKKYTAEQSKSIIDEIKYIKLRISSVEDEKDKTEPGEMFLHEQRINQAQSITDQLFKALLENTERMKLVDLDASKNLDYLKKELQDLATDTSTRVKISTDKIKNLKRGIEKAGEKQSLDLVGELNALEERKAGLTASLRSTIKLMKQLELETSEYSLQLIQSVGQIDETLLDKKVVVGLLEQWVEDAKDWLVENGPNFLVTVFTVILILFVFKLLAMLSERLVRKVIASSLTNISELLREFFENMVSKLVMLVGILVALAHVGVQIGPLLAGLGVVGFIVGFALQDTLSNFASGVMILIYKPFDTGDIIEAAGQKGTVSNMTLVSTSVMTFDNQILIIPNNKIWGDIIKNVTSQENRRVDFKFYVNRNADIDQVEGILNEIIQEHELILADPEPTIKLHQIEKYSLEFIARPWVKTDDYWQVYWDITRVVKQRFEKEAIPQPVPKQDVQIIKTVG
jgi:small conductance mechanosensitive channel